MGTAMSTPRELFLVWQNNIAGMGENEQTAFLTLQPVKESLVIAKSVIGNLISFAAVDLLVQSSWAEFYKALWLLSHSLLCLVACDFIGSYSASVRVSNPAGIFSLGPPPGTTVCFTHSCPVSFRTVVYRFLGKDYSFILCSQSQNRNVPLIVLNA